MGGEGGGGGREEGGGGREEGGGEEEGGNWGASHGGFPVGAREMGRVGPGACLGESSYRGGGGGWDKRGGWAHLPEARKPRFTASGPAGGCPG